MVKLYSGRYIVPVSTAPLEGAAIAVSDGKIIDIGSAIDLEIRYSKCCQHDFGDAIILPGFVNAHTHLELSHYKEWEKQAVEVSIDQYSSFVEWILHLIRIKISLKLKLEQYSQSWNAGLREGFATGTAYFGDILSVPELAPESAAKLPGCNFIEILGQDPERVNKQLYNLDNCVGAWSDKMWGVAPHAPYTISDELLKQCYRYSSCKHLRTTIHLAESADEVEFLATSGGAIAEKLYSFVGWQQHLPLPTPLSPLGCVAEAGGLNEQTILVHGVHLDHAEIAQVAEAGCSVVLCPRSNAKLNVGVAPVADYLRAGVPLALATDSLASNDSLSIWDEMEFALNWFDGDLSPEQLLYMGTTGGAKALFGTTEKNSLFNKGVGQLSIGAPATFQVLQPHDMPELDHIFSFLCNSERSNEVAHLFINGKEVTDAIA
ncbi:MAG: hypothetical protein B6I36_04480 [Desulfobacteraceae bacterium 4572_35.1]|nr:MAG: hypothetical protein B6I36_04480 [Desulfobacteraceae bacterium 4572_35.1]